MAQDASKLAIVPMDESNPFHLHSNENPALVLLSPLLNGANYHTWHRSMVLALRSKNKFQFVDGTVKKPAVDDVKHVAWERCNTMILSWLFHSMEPSITQSLMWFETAIGVWDDLKDMFGRGDSIRISDLQEEISGMKQGGLCVGDYFTQLKTMWDQLAQYRPLISCDCGKDGESTEECRLFKAVRGYNETDQTIRFLKGLNENYNTVKSQILLMEPLPNVSRVLFLALQHERQLMKPGGSGTMVVYGGESAALAAQGAPHAKKNWPPGKRPYCTYCHKTGHTIEKCFKKHGYPPGSKVNVQNKGSFAAEGAVYSAPTNAAQGSGDLTKDFTKLNLSQEQYSGLLQFIKQASRDSAAGKAHVDPPSNPTGYLAQSSQSNPNTIPSLSGLGFTEEDW